MTVSGPPDDYTDQLREAAHGLFSGHPMTTERTAEEVAQENAIMTSDIASLRGYALAQESALIEARAEIWRLKNALADCQKDYVRRNNDAVGRWELLQTAESRLAAMQAALEPFASAAEGLSSTSGDEIILSVRGWAIARLKPSELRAARAALSRKDGGKET